MKLCLDCETGYHDRHTTCPTHGTILGEIRELKAGMLIRQTYRIVRKLGQGGMGTVYLADHVLMEEKRALKFLSQDLSQDEGFARRFRNEARTLRRIRHKNVVDSGDLELAEDDSLFFSMEFVDGPDLWEFMRVTPKPLDVLTALGIARGIAEGLGAAHAQGMVHRDIKPENILISRSAETTADGLVPKIVDLGIVATKESAIGQSRTRTGISLLTMAYASPEQWRGVRASELDGRTDIYALGGILFEMLTGRTVFEADSYEGWAEQHRNATPEAPSKIRAELAYWEGLDALVLRMLAKDPPGRPADVVEAIQLLDAISYREQSARAETLPDLRISGTGKPNVEEKQKGKAKREIPVVTWAAAALMLLAILGLAGKERLDRQQSEVAATTPEATNPILRPAPSGGTSSTGTNKGPGQTTRQTQSSRIVAPPAGAFSDLPKPASSTDKKTTASVSGAGLFDLPAAQPAPAKQDGPNMDLFDSPSVENTTWVGKSSDAETWRYTFKPNGLLTYSDTRDVDPKVSSRQWTGTWKQEGFKISMKFREGYAEATGWLRGPHMSGEGSNKSRTKWTWTADKK